MSNSNSSFIDFRKLLLRDAPTAGSGFFTGEGIMLVSLMIGLRNVSVLED